MKLSNRVVNVKPSATISITVRANELKAQGIDVISLAAGQPDFGTPEHISAAAHNALSDGQTRYAPSNGIPPLREAICRKFERDNGLSYDASQIVVSCGAKHSLYNIFQILVEPGDEVIIPSPYWVSYPEMCILAEGTPVIVETNDTNMFRITPDQLRTAITPRTRAFVINSPSNPTGMGYDRQALVELADVLRDYPDIAIISDEIYEQLTYGDFEHVSFAAAAPDLYERTFTVNGFSKTYSMTGWRLGYTGCPDKECADAIKRIQDQSTTGTTTFAQYGGLAALEESQECVQNMLAAFDERRQYIVEALNEIPGVSCLDPQGAFYVFPNISAWNIPTFDLAMKLLDEANIAIVPGAAFGAEGYIRISFATSLDDLKESVIRLREWAASNVDG
jgi:aspartate aminotransferase